MIEKRTGTFKSFDGTEIYYEVRGQGQPLVFCYGIACLINHWTHQLKYFSRHYQTIVLDYRGHHNSATPLSHDNLTLDAICMDIKALCDHLGVKQASFWGHSFGAQILLRFFDMYPDRVANMIFINGFAEKPLKKVVGFDALSGLRAFKKGYQFFPETLRTLWKFGVTNPIAFPLSSLAGGFNLILTSMKDIEVYARGVASMDLEVFITLFERMMAYDGSPVLDRINVPVLVIGGSQDGVTPVEHQERMHKRIRGSQFLIIPYGSHCTQLDLPDFVNLRAEKFLADVGYSQTPR